MGNRLSLALNRVMSGVLLQKLQNDDIRSWHLATHILEESEFRMYPVLFIALNLQCKSCKMLEKQTYLIPTCHLYSRIAHYGFHLKAGCLQSRSWICFSERPANSSATFLPSLFLLSRFIQYNKDIATSNVAVVVARLSPLPMW